MSAARVAADLRFAAAPRTGAAANDEECCSAPSSAPPSGNATTRPKSPLYLASVRRPDGTVVTFDKHGNPTGPLPRVPALRGTEASCLALTHDRNGTRRTIVWDEENRIQSIFDNGHEKTYKEYDALQGWSNAAGDRMSGAADQGNRAIKRGPQGETVYVNQFFTSRPGANGTKHIYAGTTRIASKLMRQNTPNSNPAGKTPFEKDLYFYHPDHLGSSSYVTDLNAKLYEHLEYFPFGEAWVEENSNTQRTPYLFTAKELDEETGLYYFGARYYDPRTSVWQSGDPIFGKYLPSDPNAQERKLPAFGGVYFSHNLGLYSYTHNNPVMLRDPDGRFVQMIVTAETGNENRPMSRIFTEKLTSPTSEARNVPTFRVDIVVVPDDKNMLAEAVVVTSASVTRNAFARGERGSDANTSAASLPIADLTVTGSGVFGVPGGQGFEAEPIRLNNKGEIRFIGGVTLTDKDGVHRTSVGLHRSGLSLGCFTADSCNFDKIRRGLVQGAAIDAAGGISTEREAAQFLNQPGNFRLQINALED